MCRFLAFPRLFPLRAFQSNGKCLYFGVIICMFSVYILCIFCVCFLLDFWQFLVFDQATEKGSRFDFPYYSIFTVGFQDIPYPFCCSPILYRVSVQCRCKQIIERFGGGFICWPYRVCVYLACSSGISMTEPLWYCRYRYAACDHQGGVCVSERVKRDIRYFVRMCLDEFRKPSGQCIRVKRKALYSGEYPVRFTPTVAHQQTVLELILSIQL